MNIFINYLPRMERNFFLNHKENMNKNFLEIIRRRNNFRHYNVYLIYTQPATLSNYLYRPHSKKKKKKGNITPTKIFKIIFLWVIKCIWSFSD